MTLKVISDGYVAEIRDVASIEIMQDKVGIRFDPDTVVTTNLLDLKSDLIIAIVDE